MPNCRTAPHVGEGGHSDVIWCAADDDMYAGCSQRRTSITSGSSALTDGPRRIVSQPWDGSAPARELISFPARFTGSIYTLFDISIGPPHGSAAFVVGNFSDSADIWIAPFDTPNSARPLVATSSRGPTATLPRREAVGIYQRRNKSRGSLHPVFIGAARRLQVSTTGGWQPLWSTDGRHLHYRAPGHLMGASISGRAEFSIGRLDTLFRDAFSRHDVVNYDVFPNGKELLMIRPNAPGPAHAAIVLNWPELLHP
jgi:hypothetical protein